VKLKALKAKGNVMFPWSIEYGMEVLELALKASVYENQVLRLAKEISKCPEPHSKIK